MIWLALAALMALLGTLHLELNLFSPAARGGLRVLMYHRVGDDPARDTVTAGTLDRQLAWLRDEGWSFIQLSHLVAYHAEGRPLPPRPVLVTFDDGTADQLEVALPVLRRYGVPASFFVVPSFLGRQIDGQRYLGASELRELIAAGMEIGLHSFDHRDLSGLSPDDVEADLVHCVDAMAAHRVPTQPVLAYPFGRFPRAPAAQQAFFAALRRSGIRLAFRIGNRVNRLPLTSEYQIHRIGVRRADGPWAFAVKVRKGRRRVFA